MKAALTHPSWEQIDQGCTRLALEILAQEAYNQPQALVALVRGGMIPAARLSHLLGGIPVLAVNYSSKDGAGDNKDHLNQLAPIDDFDNLLIVDDICDTGKSMNEVISYYEADHHLSTAALFYREGALHRPNFVWQTLTESDPWVHFPWEA